MVPTLYGPSLQMKCPGCGQRFLFDPQSLTRTGEALICALCGHRQSMTDVSAQPELSSYAGDIVEVIESDAEFAIGQLVAIRWDGRIRIKRIAAVAGDELGSGGGRLVVNGQRLEDLLAGTTGVTPPRRLIVDDDSIREQSRWYSRPGAGHWQRDQQRRWYINRNSVSPWLVYHHRNVHNHHRASGVLDDYQYNAAVARQLLDVDRLSISGTFQTEYPVMLRVAFWSHEGAVVAESSVNQSGPFQISFYDGVAGDDLPVTKEAPVAIRVSGGPTTLTALRVSRAVEYRLGDDDGQSQYPIRIPQGHYYVVGDNVPFSIDSRSFGPIEAANILGRVQIVEAIGNEF